MQHDYGIDNAAGAVVRGDLNAMAQAIVSQNSGSNSPSPTYPHMLWADEANGLMKQRDISNTFWITIAKKEGSIYIPYGNTLGTPQSENSDLCATTAWTRSLNATSLIKGDPHETGGEIDNIPAVTPTVLTTNLITVSRTLNSQSAVLETITTGGNPTEIGFDLKVPGLYEFGFEGSLYLKSADSQTNEGKVRILLDGTAYSEWRQSSIRSANTINLPSYQPVSDRDYYQKVSTGSEILTLEVSMDTSGGTPRIRTIEALTFWCKCLQVG